MLLRGWCHRRQNVHQQWHRPSGSKNNLNIPNGHSESVYRRKTDTKWSKEKGPKDKEQSTKHTYKTKDRVTQTPLKNGDELRSSRRISSSCSTSDIRHVIQVTNPHCPFRGVGQGMKQTYLYLWYPLFQAQWDRCNPDFFLSLAFKLFDHEHIYSVSRVFTSLFSNL